MDASRAPQMFVLRKLIEHNLRAAGYTDDDCYFCSLSSRTIVYKGQLTPEQVRTCTLAMPHILCPRSSATTTPPPPHECPPCTRFPTPCTSHWHQ